MPLDESIHTDDGSLKIRVVAISASFLVGAALMAVKFYAYRLTGSSAVLSDALESIINVVASAFALISILLSARPPDESHPYGHGKIEFFSAGFEGALIIFAALGIFASAFSHLADPRPLPFLRGGLLILLGTAAVNLVLGVCLIRVGKRTASLTLTADGRHVLTDVYTSGGVVLGLFLVHLTGWFWMDGVIACLVGANILVIGGRLVRVSFSGLMDASDPELLTEVAGLLNAHRSDRWIDVHRLRALRSGNLIHVDFHMILPRYLTLEQAHDEAGRLETLILDHFKGMARVLVHLDPCMAPDCPVCGICECRSRTETLRRRASLDLRTVQRFHVGRGHHDEP